MSKMAKIEPKIFDELKMALVSFGDKYFVGEELNRSKLTDDLRNYDEALLSKLFEVDFIKQHFIKEVAGQKLFQIEKLEEAVLYNDYWDTSYTKYENRVGLASKKILTRQPRCCLRFSVQRWRFDGFNDQRR